MKTAKDYLEAANAEVSRLQPADAIARHGEAVFIDVRDSADIAASGTVAGALRIPRGFIEFAADDQTPFHNPLLQRDAEIILVCAAGGMAALAGKTLAEMGYSNVSNGGGISAWKEAGGPMEE